TRAVEADQFLKRVTFGLQILGTMGASWGAGGETNKSSKLGRVVAAAGLATLLAPSAAYASWWNGGYQPARREQPPPNQPPRRQPPQPSPGQPPEQQPPEQQPPPQQPPPEQPPAEQ